MTIKDLYQKYQIPPNLARHMFYVAGIGSLITDSWKGDKLDKDLVVKTCLLHDMGNLVKFDLDNLEQSKKFGLENPAEWKEAQQKFIQKYGKKSHSATFSILQEIGQTKVGEIVKKEYDLYYNHPEELEKSTFWEMKIFYYSDFRVIPTGITSLETRMKDLSTRYGVSLNNLGPAQAVEQQLQEKTKLDIIKLKNKDIEPLFSRFSSYLI